jgi:hypothetical protein
MRTQPSNPILPNSPVGHTTVKDEAWKPPLIIDCAPRPYRLTN